MTRCYAWPLAVEEGPLQLHVSTEHERFAVRLFRAGATIEEVAAPAGIFDGADVPLGRPDEGWGWPRYSLELDAALSDGIYVAVPVPVPVAGDGEAVPVAGTQGTQGNQGSDAGAGDGRADADTHAIAAEPALLTRRDACLFILRRHRPASGVILFKLPTATYGAYNQLGGVSLYAGAHWIRDWTGQGYVVSTQRPGNGGIGGKVMEGDAPDPYTRSSRRQVFAHWDAPFVAWLESAGHRATYCTDFDLDEDEHLLEGCSLLLSAGHDEYWSPAMRRRVLEFVDRGGNVAFFGGDTACFEIDIAAAGDRLTCPKMAGGGPDSGELLTGALWHVDDPGDWLTLASGRWGGGWWDGSRSLEAYQPVVPSHWVFDGVEFPPEGISGGAATPVIGYETDGVPLELGADPPRMRPAAKGGTGGRVLLAVAKLSGGWVAAPDQPNAAMMTRTARSGGIVFSAGTTDWPLAIASDERVRRITANVVGTLAHPSLLLHGPTYRDEEYLGEGDAVGAGQVVSFYLDGAQGAALGLGPATWSVDGGERLGEGPVLAVRANEGGSGWLTVTVRATDSSGVEHFASRTVAVLDRETYLRRRIVRTLHWLTNPDEQGGNLVDQKASEAELATRVIPVRLRWVQHHAAVLDELLGELDELWEASGRMADASLREEEK